MGRNGITGSSSYHDSVHGQQRSNAYYPHLGDIRSHSFGRNATSDGVLQQPSMDVNHTLSSADLLNPCNFILLYTILGDANSPSTNKPNSTDDLASPSYFLEFHNFMDIDPLYHH